MKGSSEPLPYICREIRFVFRYIGLLANMTFDTGVRENAQEEKTSRLAASMFKQVSFASAWMHVRNVRSQKIFHGLFLDPGAWAGDEQAQKGRFEHILMEGNEFACIINQNMSENLYLQMISKDSYKILI